MGFRHSEALPVGWLPDFWATISVIKHVNHKTLDTPMNSTVAHRPRSCPGILSTAFVFHRSSVHTMSHSSKSIFTWTTFIHCITCPISVRFGIICLGVWCHHHKITVDAGLSLRYNVITSKSTGSLHFLLSVFPAYSGNNILWFRPESGHGTFEVRMGSCKNVATAEFCVCRTMVGKVVPKLAAVAAGE